MKRQPTEWAEIFGNHVSDKVLISNIYKEPLQLSKNSERNQLNEQRA